MTLKSVRVAANASNKEWETVNIVTTQTGHNFEQCAQVTALQATANLGEFATVQDSGGGVAGLRTIQIAGYTAPN